MHSERAGFILYMTLCIHANLADCGLHLSGIHGLHYLLRTCRRGARSSCNVCATPSRCAGHTAAVIATAYDQDKFVQRDGVAPVTFAARCEGPLPSRGRAKTKRQPRAMQCRQRTCEATLHKFKYMNKDNGQMGFRKSPSRAHLCMLARWVPHQHDAIQTACARAGLTGATVG